MKTSILLISIILLIANTGCNKDSSLTEFTATGQDLSMRPCSGGFVGKIGTETVRIFDIIDNQLLTESTKLPKTYLIKYERPTGGCYDENDGVTKIKVTEIQAI